MKRIYSITEQYISTITYTVQVDSTIDDKRKADPMAEANARRMVQDGQDDGEVVGSGDFETDFQSGEIIDVEDITMQYPSR